MSDVSFAASFGGSSSSSFRMVSSWKGTNSRIIEYIYNLSVINLSSIIVIFLHGAGWQVARSLAPKNHYES